MPLNALAAPTIDPSPIFELFRGSYATEILTAAVAHFNVFEILREKPLSFDALRNRIGLAERPANVLATALLASGLLVRTGAGLLDLSPLAREHLAGGSFDICGYVGLAAQAPGVLEMTERLKSNRPAGAKPDESGAAFIYREGIESAMEKEASARHLTLALAGRAKNVAPVLAARVPLNNARVILDVGGGTGIYSIACLQKNPQLRAVIWDRPEVLKVAAEMASAYGVEDRIECRPGDMFAGPVPAGADVILLSNILHDWDVPQCRDLLSRCAAALPSGGKLLIHDVFLNDALDGPLPIALYSAALFTLTEGRAYSAAEYKRWLSEANLKPADLIPTLAHCAVLPATR